MTATSFRVKWEDIQLVYYDLETTGLSAPRQITQIGAISGIYTFSVHVCPTRNIPPQAVARTGLARSTVGQLCKGGTLLPGAMAIKDALNAFIQFLLSVTLSGKKVVLIGHNIASYDNPILREEASNARVTTALNNCIYGYIDTLMVFKAAIPGHINYKQHTLVEYYIDRNYKHAHEAVADAQALGLLVNKLYQYIETELKNKLQRW